MEAITGYGVFIIVDVAVLLVLLYLPYYILVVKKKNKKRLALKYGLPEEDEKDESLTVDKTRVCR